MGERLYGFQTFDLSFFLFEHQGLLLPPSKLHASSHCQRVGSQKVDIEYEALRSFQLTRRMMLLRVVLMQPIEVDMGVAMWMHLAVLPFTSVIGIDGQLLSAGSIQSNEVMRAAQLQSC